MRQRFREKLKGATLPDGTKHDQQECKELEKRKAGYFLHRETGTRSWYLMRISEQWVYCLFQKSLGFTTVLTPEQFWRSFPNVKLPMFRADSKFADAWTVARHDQKKHKPRNKAIVSRGRV